MQLVFSSFMSESGQDFGGLDVIDVDQDEQLVEQYDELVPVLIGIRDQSPPVQICHYFLDTAKLSAFLAG